MSKRGLPLNVHMRHDSHYVEILSASTRSIGKTILINLIAPNPEQPRREIGDLTELSNSIREKGVLEPLLVKPNGDGSYMIIAGERRWRASKLAGLTEVPCIEMDIDEHGIAEIALIENLQRKDLTVWEEADGLKALADKFGYKQDEIAKKISKSRTTVTELLTIAGLPSEIREKCYSSKITSKATLLEIARQFDESAMVEFLNSLGNGSASPKQRTQKISQTKAAVVQELDKNGGLKSFRYNSSKGGFELSINFTGELMVSKGAVLKALKEVFNEVKANHQDA